MTELEHNKIVSLRMERQHLIHPVSEAAYPALYRDTSPGLSEYFHGFGNPPSLAFRTDFDDMEYNRKRQAARELLKGRFLGGNLGWVEREDLPLFAAMARKPLAKPTENQASLLDLIRREGPMNIQRMKEITGLLVKEITPALHRLQEAFLVYEDQYDGEWDRGWYLFEEMFPQLDVGQYTRLEALKVLLPRFADRNVLFDAAMAKSFYRLPAKDIKAALEALAEDGVLLALEDGYMLPADRALLEGYEPKPCSSVYAMHRNDFLVRSNEHSLKDAYKHPDWEILYYILLDGEFCGAVLGQFKYGPYIIEDVVLSLPDDVIASRKGDIIDAIYRVNDRKDSPILRFQGMEWAGSL